MKSVYQVIFGILIGAAIALLGNYLLSARGMLAIIALLAAACVGLILCNKILSRTGLMALYRRCDPEAAIDSLLPKLAAARRKQNLRAEKYCVLNLAAACHAHGETDKALVLLAGITPEGEKPTFAILYWEDVAAMQWDKAQLSASFWEAWRQAGEAAANWCRQGKRNRQIEFFMAYLQALIDVTNQDFPKALAWFESALKRLPKYNLYLKVMLTYNMACIYERQGLTEQSQTAFEFVVKQGNKLHVVGLARERLNAN